jgi:hypothetical protein
MEDNNLYALQEEVVQLQKHGNPLWTQTFEKLDRLRVQGILQADRRCRKLKVGQIPWSPAIQQCMHRIGYLQSCRRKFVFGHKVNSRTLLHLFRNTDLQAPVLSGEEATAQLKIQYNNLNLLKSQATQLRSSFLAELAYRKASEGNGKAETFLKQLLLREEQRSVARATKRVLRQSRGSVTAIEAQSDTDGTWNIYTDKNTIEAECIKENIARFTQASHLPVMQATTLQEIGLFAETPTSESILRRELVATSTHLDASIVRLAPYLYRPDTVQDISCLITKEQYVHEWSRGREFTATGISHVHFGHFKASCLDNELVEMDRRMAEISLTSGYPLQRWKRGIDVMIPKKSSSLRAAQLRTIHL